MFFNDYLSIWITDLRMMPYFSSDNIAMGK